MVMFLAFASTTSTFAQKNAGQSSSSASIFNGVNLTGKEPLYFVSEGQTAKEISREEFEKIDSRHIHSVYILRNQNAIDRYGERARYGAIIVTMKGKSFAENYPAK